MSSSDEYEYNNVPSRRVDFMLDDLGFNYPNLTHGSNNHFLRAQDDDGFCSHYSVKQFAQSIVEFSSQYGSDYSISYTAQNLVGKPTKFPEYGDFPECFAMRTYGNWWDMSPSRDYEIQPQNLPKIRAQDFIVLEYENYTFPEEIAIFESFNPGAVIRIWAYTLCKKWELLWETNDLVANCPADKTKSRRFTPPIKKLAVPTKIIKLEFNHSQLDYFTQIDAVMITGKCARIETDNIFENFPNSGIILRRLNQMRFQPLLTDNNMNRFDEFLRNELYKFKNFVPEATPKLTAATTSTSDAVAKVEQKTITLNEMPFEILLHIFSYLDLVTLFRVGRVSHFFYDVSTHPLLYSEINLKPYWNLITTSLITTLAKRAKLLKKLDMSWCGQFNKICTTEFKKFIQQRGDSLTHLRLNTCRFLNSSCIETLGIVCDNLKELSLRNCSSNMPLFNYSCLANLKNLERLDLFESLIDQSLLLPMLENNRKLKHLNLAYCGVSVNMDEVAKTIGANNHELITLDLWKSHFLTATGLRALANCHALEEVDFGWCLREASLGDSLRVLINNCPNLTKLFLATVRGITDADVAYIAKMCPKLEQLDLMGVMCITKDRYYDILCKCTNLKLLDLSFCDNVDQHQINIWMSTFNVQIKYSHVPAEGREPLLNE